MNFLNLSWEVFVDDLEGNEILPGDEKILCSLVTTMARIEVTMLLRDASKTVYPQTGNVEPPA